MKPVLPPTSRYRPDTSVASRQPRAAGGWGARGPGAGKPPRVSSGREPPTQRLATSPDLDWGRGLSPPLLSSPLFSSPSSALLSFNQLFP